MIKLTYTRRLKLFLGYFFKGLLATAPLYVTFTLIIKVIQRVDSILNLTVPGLGAVIVVAFVAGIGYLVSNIIVKSTLSSIQQFIRRIPGVNIVYASVQDVFDAFIGDKNKLDKPVLVNIDGNKEIYRIGFITQEDLSQMNMPGMVSVYILTSYSFSGDLIIVPRDQVKPIDLSSKDVSKFVLSGGIINL